MQIFGLPKQALRFDFNRPQSYGPETSILGDSCPTILRLDKNPPEKSNAKFRRVRKIALDRQATVFPLKWIGVGRGQ